MAARPDFPSPQCPQFRAARQAGAGYCLRAGPAGHLMIPSTEEFRTLCTMPHFRHCPWFGAPQTSGAPGARPRDNAGKVIDLMEALRRSLAGQGGGSKERAERFLERKNGKAVAKATLKTKTRAA
jgi:hypothetical protein